MKRCGAILLGMVFLLLWGSALAEFAEAGSGIQPRYDLTDTVTAGLSISSSGVATCKGRIAPTYDDCTSSVTVRLQRKSGNSWVTLRTWTASGTGTHGSSAGGIYTLTTHGTYRVYVSGTVVASDGTREPVSKSTPNKYY